MTGFTDVWSELHRLGIHLRQRRPGNHKVPCPWCSTQRKKKRDPCLSVIVGPAQSRKLGFLEDGQAAWFGHHCDLKGGIGHGDTERQRRPLGRGKGHTPLDLGARRRRLRYNGDAGRW